jgi:hypothetical protein
MRSEKSDLPVRDWMGLGQGRLTTEHAFREKREIHPNPPFEKEGVLFGDASTQ